MLRLMLTALLIAVVGPGCAASSDGANARTAPAGISCGLRAAMNPRQPKAVRDAPPACALPTREEVASSCAAHDHVTSPDYRPSIYDEEGQLVWAQPMPEYVASELRCRFTSRARNKADCRFTLELPQGGASESVVRFEHRFWMDHGPAHHFYGTQWSPIDRCTPLPGNKRI